MMELAHVECQASGQWQQRLIEVISRLGERGGLMTASVYDTAVALRAGVVPEGERRAVVEWLLERQRGDGGWESPGRLLPRLASTMAALLALDSLAGADAQARHAVVGAHEFLTARTEALQDDAHLLLDQVMSGEVILPKLADDCAAAGYAMEPAHFEGIRKIRARRLAMVRSHQQSLALSTVAHAWEALDLPVRGDEPDLTGGVGHSPAATATWLAAARAQEIHPSKLRHAQAYLRSASGATVEAIPGILPPIFPTTVAEKTYALYPLVIAGVNDIPALRDHVRSSIAVGRALFTAYSGCVGSSPAHPANVDDTAALLALDPDLDERNAAEYFDDGRGSLMCFPPVEMNPSPLSIAKFAVAARRRGRPRVELERHLAAMRGADGLWPADKWHYSPLSTTMNAVFALAHDWRTYDLSTTAATLYAMQQDDGSWGVAAPSSPEESTMACLALLAIRDAGVRSEDLDIALGRAHGYLERSLRQAGAPTPLWVGKVPYAAPNWDLPGLLAALVRLAPLCSADVD